MKKFLYNFSRKPTMKKLWIIILVVGIFLYIYAEFQRSKAFFGPGLTDPLATYYSEYGNFVISYPENWRGVDTPQGDHGDPYTISIIKPFRTWPGLIISAKDFNSGDIDQVVVWGEERAQVNDYYKEVERKVFEFHDLRGYSREYTWKSESLISGQRLIHCLDYYLLNQNRGFILSFCADDPIWIDSKIVFQKMIESFQFR